MQENIENLKLLREVDAASLLGVSPGQLRLSRHTGELFKGVPAPKFLKMGKAIRYPYANLDNWLMSREEFQSNSDVRLQRAGDAS